MRKRIYCIFVADKVANIRFAIDQHLEGKQSDPIRSDKLFIGKPLSGLKPVLHTEVKQIIHAMTGKPSPQVFILTKLLNDMQQCVRKCHSLVGKLMFFAEGLFPIQFKTAQMTPIIKIAGLDTSNPASYKPISNLNTISKVLERLYLARPIPHVSLSTCLLQSAYRQFHSTETILLKIANDLFEATESGCVTVLFALNLSSAFDTIDHQVLVQSTRSESRNWPSVG